MYPSKTTRLCIIGLTTALICIMAQLSIPLPFGIPMTMQTFAVMLTGILLGSKTGTLCITLYLLLGVFGLPVFSNFSGGIFRLLGPTGGFLWSFPCMTYLIGLGVKYRSKYKGSFLSSLIIANVINLLCGTLHYAITQHVSIRSASVICVLPFLLPTILKIICAAAIGIRLKIRLAPFLSFPSQQTEEMS